MRRLPRTIDFNDTDFPELAEIFRAIDADIAALVASGPVYRGGPARPEVSAASRPNSGEDRPHRQAA